MQLRKNVRPITFRQKRAVECWIRNRRRSKAQALREAGYSKAIISQPHKVFDSKAVQLEFVLRGLGIDGKSQNMPTCPEEYGLKEPETIDIDFSQMTEEQLRELKAKLAATPDDNVNYYPPFM